MKPYLLRLTLGLALMAAPALAQESPSTLPLDAAAEQWQRLAPSQAQSQALMQLLMGQLPRLMDDNADPAKLAKELSPQVESLLDPQQIQMLRQMEAEMGPATNFGTMSREERRKLIQGGLQRLSHPDTSEWLKKVDSFDL